MSISTWCSLVENVTRGVAAGTECRVFYSAFLITVSKHLLYDSIVSK